MKTWTRIRALVFKELVSLIRDPRTRFTLVAPPLLQLIVFTYAVTLDVNNISFGIYNQDRGWYSHELVQRITGSPYFTRINFYNSPQEVREAINAQKVMGSLQLQSDFSRKIAAGKPAPLQVILDGRRSNAAQIANGYLNQIFQTFNTDILKDRGISPPEPVSLEYRSFFNPNIDYIYFTVPSLVAILSMLLAVMITSLSVSRERENGTFDQLLVSPLQHWEILIGKTIPALIISIGEGSLLMFLSEFLFKVPFVGSYLLLYFSLTIFLLSVVGVGLFISSISHTQQQAILGSFVFMTPTVLLSGYATPIENMPTWLQPWTNLIPIKHFFIIIKGIFLKDMGVREVLSHTWPMVLIGAFTLSLASWMFRRRME